MLVGHKVWSLKKTIIKTNSCQYRYTIQKNNNQNSQNSRSFATLIDASEFEENVPIIKRKPKATKKIKIDSKKEVQTKETEQQKVELSKSKEHKLTPVDSKLIQKLNELKLGRQRILKRPKEFKNKPLDFSDLGDDSLISTSLYFRPSSCRLTKEAHTVAMFPEDTLPEVCFIGRSNVGKSSLLNAICSFPLSKTSSKPGETTNIRWYTNSNLIHLIDLPGYGFSYANQDRSSAWVELAKEFLKSRKMLKRCFVLIDSRHPLRISDVKTLEFLEDYNIKYQVVLTKADLVSVEDLAKRIVVLQREINARPKAIHDILAVSASTKSGLAALRKQLIALFDPEAKRQYEELMDKKHAVALKRREKRQRKEEEAKEILMKKQKMHSRNALLKHVKEDKRAAAARRKSSNSL